MKPFFAPSSAFVKFVFFLFAATPLFGVDQKNDAHFLPDIKKSEEKCPGGVCSARPALEEGPLGETPLFQMPQSDSPPAAAQKNPEMGFSLSPAAKIDFARFEKYRQKIEEQESLLVSKLANHDKEKTVVVIGAKDGVKCPRCEAAAQAYEKVGFKVIKVPYDDVPHIGSAMWLQDGQKGGPQFPFVGFWSGKNFFYRSYQP